MELNATEMMCTDVTAKEKKRKERQILKPACDIQKLQKVLEIDFFFSPAASLTEEDAVEMIVADDL